MPGASILSSSVRPKSLSPEMFPTLRAKSLPGSVLPKHHYLLPARDLADPRDGNLRDASRDRFPLGRSKEQLVIFAPIERKAEIDSSLLSADLRAGNGRCRDFGTHPRLLADVAQIGGEAVAQIDHGRGKPPLAEKPADRNAWNGREVSRKIL